MYRLVLKLPFEVVIVIKESYPTWEDASKKLNSLPSGFEIVDEKHVAKGAIEVPFKDTRTKV